MACSTPTLALWQSNEAAEARPARSTIAHATKRKDLTKKAFDFPARINFIALLFPTIYFDVRMKNATTALLLATLSCGIPLISNAGQEDAAIDHPALLLSKLDSAGGPPAWVDERFVNWFMRKEDCKNSVLALRGDSTQQLYLNGHRLRPTSSGKLCVSPWNILSIRR
ncbi:hypothetical protein [Ralstonia holmesii]|uniref:hypothetical protein n=1 Tax=Ralstonia holmesii TaxID=3058602 RepID=UPI003F19008F